ncbi:MAG: CvpA family protein, partial [Clostridia bacterium]|nr:CvpA family protein [Clostridia bacterium]
MELSTIAGIAGFIAPILFILCLAIGTLAGLIRCLMRGALHLAKVIASVLLSIPLTMLIVSFAADKGVEALIPVLENAGIQLSDAPNTSEAVVHLLRAVVAVAIFTTVFLIMLALLGIVTLILRGLFKKLESVTLKSGFLSRILGALTGALAGAIFCIAFFMPLFGLGRTVFHTTQTLLEQDPPPKYVQENREMLEDSNTVSDALTNNGVSDFMWNAGQRGLYRSVTTVNTEHGKAVLDDEVDAAAIITVNVMNLSEKEFDEYGEAEVASIRLIVDQLRRKDVVILSELVAGFLNDASNAWLNGKTFLGIEAPGMDSDYNALFVSVYTMFSKTSPETVGDDLAVFADMLGTLQEYEVLSKLSDTDELLAALTQEGLLTELIDTLASNENTAVLIDGLVDAALAMVSDELGLPENSREVLDNIINESADAWNEVLAIEDETERVEALEEKLDEIFTEYDVDISDSMIESVAAVMVEEFSEIGEIDPDNMQEFLLAVAASYASNLTGEEGENESAYAGLPVVQYTAEVEPGYLGGYLDRYYKLIRSTPIEFLVDVLRNEGYSLSMISAAYSVKLEMLEGTLSMDEALGNYETFKTSLVTASELKGALMQEMFKKNEDGICNLETVLGIATQAISGGDGDMTAILTNLGGVASTMSGASVRTFLKTVLGAEDLGLKADMRKALNKAISGVSDGDLEVFAGKMPVLAELSSYVEELEKNANPENVMTGIMAVLDEQTAKVFAKFMSEDLLVSFGIPKEEAAGFSALLQSSFNAYTDSEENAKAINELIVCGFNLGQKTELFGEDSITGVSASEFAKIMTDSSMVMAALDAIGNDPLGLAAYATEENIAVLESEL